MKNKQAQYFSQKLAFKRKKKNSFKEIFSEGKKMSFFKDSMRIPTKKNSAANYNLAKIASAKNTDNTPTDWNASKKDAEKSKPSNWGLSIEFQSATSNDFVRRTRSGEEIKKKLNERKTSFNRLQKKESNNNLDSLLLSPSRKSSFMFKLEKHADNIIPIISDMSPKGKYSINNSKFKDSLNSSAVELEAENDSAKLKLPNILNKPAQILKRNLLPVAVTSLEFFSSDLASQKKMNNRSRLRIRKH